MAYFDSRKRWAREDKIFIPMPYLGMTEGGYLDLRISNLPIQAKCFDRSLVEKRMVDCPSALLSDKDEVVETSVNPTGNIWFWFGLKPEKDPSTKKDLPGSLIVDPNHRCWVITHQVESRFIVLPAKLTLKYQTGRPMKQPTVYIQSATHNTEFAAVASSKPGHVANIMPSCVAIGAEVSVQRYKIGIKPVYCKDEKIKLLELSRGSQSDDCPKYVEVKKDEQTAGKFETEVSKFGVTTDYSVSTISPLTIVVRDHGECGNSPTKQPLREPDSSNSECHSPPANKAPNPPISLNGEFSELTKSMPVRKALKPKKKRKRCRFCCIQ